MRLGYTIIYVPDVGQAVRFYQAAFGLGLRMLHESGLYAEMETGATTLSFAAEEMAGLMGAKIRPNRPGELAAGIEIALIAQDVPQAYARALEAGALAVAPPVEKPWGQIVSYVRDAHGVLVEICSAVLAPAAVLAP